MKVWGAPKASFDFVMCCQLFICEDSVLIFQLNYNSEVSKNNLYTSMILWFESIKPCYPGIELQRRGQCTGCQIFVRPYRMVVEAVADSVIAVAIRISGFVCTASSAFRCYYG